MIRTLVSKYAGEDANGNPVQYVELAGDNDDLPPTEGIATGSMLLLTNTGEVVLFNEDSQKWYRTDGTEYAPEDGESTP